MLNWKSKYLKYKLKYEKLIGGANDEEWITVGQDTSRGKGRGRGRGRGRGTSRGRGRGTSRGRGQNNQMCRHFLSGNCTYGNKCIFVHAEPQFEPQFAACVPTNCTQVCPTQCPTQYSTQCIPQSQCVTTSPLEVVMMESEPDEVLHTIKQEIKAKKTRTWQKSNSHNLKYEQPITYSTEHLIEHLNNYENDLQEKPSAEVIDFLIERFNIKDQNFQEYLRRLLWDRGYDYKGKKPINKEITINGFEKISKVQIQFYDEVGYKNKFLKAGHYFYNASTRGPGGGIEPSDLEDEKDIYTSIDEFAGIALKVATRELEEEFGLTIHNQHVRFIDNSIGIEFTIIKSDYDVIKDKRGNHIYIIKITLENNSVSEMKDIIIENNNDKGLIEVTSLNGGKKKFK